MLRTTGKIMASTAKAYRNPDSSSSENERHFFTRAEIENFFETCPPALLSRRFHHFLRGAWIAAGRPFGREILFFKAVDHYRRACRYRSERTVRYNLRAAESLGLLEIAHRREHGGHFHHIWIRPRTETDRGEYRRVTTHRLPISLLLQWRQSKRTPSDVTPIRKPAQPPPPPTPPAPPAAKPEHRSPRSAGGGVPRGPRQLTPREGPRLVAAMADLMRGCSGNIQARDGAMMYVGPDHPNYRAPMTQEEALSTACMTMGIPYDAAREHLKLCRWSFENDAGDSS